MKNAIITTGGALLVHYQKELATAVEHLNIRHDVGRLSGMFAELIYFLANPECISDLEKESILDHSIECISLLGELHTVYEKFDSLKAYTDGLDQ